MLHGAGGNANQAMRLVARIASEENLIVVAPKSADSTWDVLHGHFGPDVSRIDRVLAAVFARYAVDPDRISIGGFSDGASYALTLGLANGDLFRTILAFSPGFEAAPKRRGRPHIFVSHGTDDGVLPIHRTSHRLVRELRRGRYDLTYLEFAGGHVVPEDAVVKALALLRPATD
jgi:predicted esterase